MPRLPTDPVNPKAVAGGKRTTGWLRVSSVINSDSPPHSDFLLSDLVTFSNPYHVPHALLDQSESEDLV